MRERPWGLFYSAIASGAADARGLKCINLMAGLAILQMQWELALSEVFMIRSFRGIVPQVPDSCYVDISAQVLGDVVLGERSSVWMNAVVRGDVHSIRIGAHSNVQDCAVLHGQRYKHPVLVGDWVTIGHNATIHGCTIEDNVLIGLGARVLNNCRIGSGSIIAAGSVVPENTIVPPRTLWAGVPAKQRREVSDQDFELIREYAANYLDYVDEFLAETKGQAR